MKKILISIIFCLFISCSFCFGEALEGKVSFDVSSAREYLQEGQQNYIEINAPYFLKTDNTQRVIYSHNPLGKVIGITVQYKGDNTNAYIYDSKNRLIYVDKYDKPIHVYPHRGYRYNLDGKLILTSLTVSKNEMFRFDTEGNLIAHSINGVIYDENGKIIGSGK